MYPFFKTLKDLVNHFFSSTPAKQPPVAVVAPVVHKPYEDPKPPIKKVAVIGAGVMGAGIAAQFANAGIDVVLLDKFPGAAQNAIDKMLKATPATDAMNAGLMLKDHAKRITVGTTDDNMGMIADADWIVEVVPEILPIKHATFRAIDQHRKPGSIVSSNTSTIPLSTLSDGMSDNFKKDFMISHFFNPVRFMELLEVVVGPETSKDAVDMVKHIGDVHLGKKVVISHDTPGFIGNRIGTFMIQRAIAEAMDNNLKIEEIDAALGRGVGFPKDGIFGLMDIVGLDLGPKVTGSLDKALPAGDSFHALLRTIPALSPRWPGNSPG